MPRPGRRQQIHSSVPSAGACRSYCATERTHHLIKQRSFHFHQMAALGEAAFPDVGDVFAEGGEAFRLQAAVFGDVIAVGAGGAGPVCES